MTLSDLIKKLDGEWLETNDPRYSAYELASRNGWNTRNRAILFDLRTAAGLEQTRAGLDELRDAPAMDLRLRAELVGLDTDQDGEG